jgi:hypothetical protein
MFYPTTTSASDATPSTAHWGMSLETKHSSMGVRVTL